MTEALSRLVKARYLGCCVSLLLAGEIQGKGPVEHDLTAGLLPDTGLQIDPDALRHSDRPADRLAVATCMGFDCPSIDTPSSWWGF